MTAKPIKKLKIKTKEESSFDFVTVKNGSSGRFHYPQQESIAFESVDSVSKSTALAWGRGI